VFFFFNSTEQKYDIINKKCHSSQVITWKQQNSACWPQFFCKYLILGNCHLTIIRQNWHFKMNNEDTDLFLLFTIREVEALANKIFATDSYFRNGNRWFLEVSAKFTFVIATSSHFFTNLRTRWAMENKSWSIAVSLNVKLKIGQICQQLNKFQVMTRVIFDSS
jgi:hypothetical protein